MKKPTHRAFTVIELLIVMSIIAILLGMSPVFMQAAQHGIAKVRSVKDKHDQSLLNQLKPDENETVPGNLVPASFASPTPVVQPSTAQPLPRFQNTTMGIGSVSTPIYTAPSQDQLRSMAMQIVEDARNNPPSGGSTYTAVPSSWPQ